MSSARLLAGKPHADAILADLAKRLPTTAPLLAIVHVGSDPASSVYIKHKIAACERIGIAHKHLELPESTTVAELQKTIASLNADTSVTGYIVQLPVPEHLWKAFPELTASMDPRKDVDGFTAMNFGTLALFEERGSFVPATPAGVIHLLEAEKIVIAGKHVVIVGRSNLVGKPLALMFLHRDATVTICHSKTKDLSAITQTADILVSAVGKPNLITADMVKPGAVVVDIGITRENNKLVGDVAFGEVAKKASAITPVPGGVGPLTVACLLKNVVAAAEQKH